MGNQTETVLIPSGDFLMGSVSGDGSASEEEKPQHVVTLDSFTIDIHLVSVEKFYGFIWETGYRPEGWQDHWLESPKQPVRNLKWSDIQKFCEWSGGRLPTEAEWEKSARGGMEGGLYPWGSEEFNGTQAFDGQREGDPADIGLFPPNGYGIYDIVGSLWQWCIDDRRLYTGDRRSNPIGPLDGETRSVRGGDWYSSAYHKRCSRRGGAFLKGKSGNIGFRCVFDDK